MPKIKTHKGAAKRFRLTGTGKFVQMKGLSSHLRRNKAKRSKELFDKTLITDKTNIKKLKKLLPYA